MADTMRTDDLTIGEVADETGLSTYALRYFEDEGLFIRTIARTSSGRRRYGREDVDWLHLCLRFRASGMPIATIAAFAELVRRGPGTERERLALLRGHEARVRAKIADLEDDLAIITAKVSTYERHVADGTAAGVWDPSVARH